MGSNIRNDLALKYKNMIWWTIHRNQALLYALRLEWEDVYQELFIALILAIDGFDPTRSSSIVTHISAQLQYAVLDLKKRYKACGLVGVDSRSVAICSYDQMLEEQWLDLPSQPGIDTGTDEPSEGLSAFTILSHEELDAVQAKLNGIRIRRKAQCAALESAMEKLKQYYLAVCPMLANV